MFSLDDRTGNVLTTAALFAIGAAILYLARIAFLVLLISVLFAFLVEPAVSWFECHSPFRNGNRDFAIVEVYFAGIAILGLLAYQLGPHLAVQARKLNASLSSSLTTLSSGNPAAGSVVPASSSPTQLWIFNLLVQHRNFVQSALERTARSVAAIAANSIWLLAIPILAVFVLRDGRRMVQKIVEAIGPPEHKVRVQRVLQRLDAMLASYVRAQLGLAGLSFVFYSLSMFLLGFPYAMALGAFGGALEFLPAIGWIVSAASILTIGFVTHSHWIWMSALLAGWRLVQNYVNSPHIMGNSLKLEPLTVVFGLMVGAQVGGIPGVFLSVPTIAALRIVCSEWRAPTDSADESSELLVHAKT